MTTAKHINRVMDRFVQPNLTFTRQEWSTFQFFGHLGLGMAAIAASALVWRGGLSHWMLAGLVVTTFVTIKTTAYLTYVITGADRLTYHHHEIAVLGATSVLLWTRGQPMLEYLDIVTLGAGIFLLTGRIGCLKVGCCHGHPHNWGICYGREHTRSGLPSHLVGVRLFPIQAVESIYVLLVVAVGIVLVWTRQAPGAALAWYFIAHNVGRFCLEFFRGDLGRPHCLGYSEAQWTGLVLTGTVVVLEWVGVLPYTPWHTVIPPLLAATMIVLGDPSRHRELGRRRLYHPTHVAEMAAVLNRRLGASPGSDIVVEQTSLGVRISAGSITADEQAIEHYTLSVLDRSLSARGAAQLANLVLTLRSREWEGNSLSGKLYVRAHGAYQLVLERRDNAY